MPLPECYTFGIPFAMNEAAARTLRTAERYLLQPPLAGHFGGAAVSICDISTKGARFTHDDTVERAQMSPVRGTHKGPPAPRQVEAVVVWPQVNPVPRSRFVSGVRTY